MQRLALQTDSRGVVAVLFDASQGAAEQLETAIVDHASTPDELAKALKGALPKLGGKLDLAVALGPSEVRCRRLEAPPAPDNEMPAIVAMQAAREAGADSGPLVADYLPRAASMAAAGASDLLCAWAEESTIDYWSQTATRLGGRLAVVTPRALAAPPPEAEAACAVIASRAGDEVDISVWRRGHPHLARSSRPANADAAAADRELQRTLLALEDGLGSPTTVATWREEEAAGFPTEQRDALAAYALGAGGPTPLNLADPRRAEVESTGSRRQALLVAATVVVLLAGAWFAYDRLAAVDRRIAELQAQLDAAEEDIEAYEPYRKQVTALNGWLDSDVTWLDEIDRLSTKLRPEAFDSDSFPVAEDVRVTQFTATATIGSPTPGGRIRLTALAKQSSTDELEARLRDDRHLVEPISTAESENTGAYGFEYTANLLTPPAEEETP